jgi:hypothetical protein
MWREISIAWTGPEEFDATGQGIAATMTMAVYRPCSVESMTTPSK